MAAALAVAQGEISPISDVRGSADYKRLLTRQLLIAHFTGLFPDRLSVGDFDGGDMPFAPLRGDSP